jgi:hypothetical protein
MSAGTIPNNRKPCIAEDSMVVSETGTIAKEEEEEEEACAQQTNTSQPCV